MIFDRYSVGRVSDSVTRQDMKASLAEDVGLRCARQPLHALLYLLHPCSRNPTYVFDIKAWGMSFEPEISIVIEANKCCI